MVRTRPRLDIRRRLFQQPPSPKAAAGDPRHRCGDRDTVAHPPTRALLSATSLVLCDTWLGDPPAAPAAGLSCYAPSPRSAVSALRASILVAGPAHPPRGRARAPGLMGTGNGDSPLVVPIHDRPVLGSGSQNPARRPTSSGRLRRLQLTQLSRHVLDALAVEAGEALDLSD